MQFVLLSRHTSVAKLYKCPDVVCKTHGLSHHLPPIKTLSTPNFNIHTSCIFILHFVQQVLVHLYTYASLYLNSLNRSLTFFGTALYNIHVLAIRRYHPIIIILQQNFPLIIRKYGSSCYKA